MVRRGTLLFYERSLSDVLSELDVRMKNEIDSISKNLLLTEGVDALCDRLEEKYRVNVPRLIDEETTVEQGDAQIDVSQDPLRSVQDRSRPAYITGTGVTFYVPSRAITSYSPVRPLHGARSFPERRSRAMN